MSAQAIQRAIQVPASSAMTVAQYGCFLHEAWVLFRQYPQYLSATEDINSLELAHLYPPAPESVIAIYVGINDAVCNKGLISPFLVRHSHNHVFAFDPERYRGGREVPAGTVDAADILSGFEPPNETWPRHWTYVMIADSGRTVQSLWRDAGYIDMIPAKFEDFTMLGDPATSRVCFFIDPEAFRHPVNATRAYLGAARDRGAAQVHGFRIPVPLAGEVEGLEPVVLDQGEKLYVARPDGAPCAHAWSNLHPDNTGLAVINENSAVPLDLVVSKPPVNPRFSAGLVPPRGSADMTTDWFRRGREVHRQALLQGAIRG